MSGIAFTDLKVKHRSTKFKPGYYLGGYFGYRLPYQFRIEGEISYQRSEIDHFTNMWLRRFTKAKGHIRSWSYMVNALYEFDFDFPLKPYVGIGVGYAQTRGYWHLNERVDGFAFFFTDAAFSFKQDSFAWQPILGVDYQICKNLKASIDYRFVSMVSDIKTHRFGLSLTGLF